jgi:REP element-mobilizing transposase RayT
MTSNNADDYLKRLPRTAYQGEAVVHWSLTIDGRRTGWLTPIFYYKYRELLTHTAFRYGFSCPIFCCMPDHVHMLWMGLVPTSNQLNAMKFFRTRVNEVLRKIGFELQPQGFDHVLQEHELEKTAFQSIFEYIARNPERKNLVPIDAYAKYPYTSCIVPGYPELKLFLPDFWDRLDRIHSRLKETQIFRLQVESDSYDSKRGNASLPETP